MTKKIIIGACILALVTSDTPKPSDECKTQFKACAADSTCQKFLVADGIDYQNCMANAPCKNYILDCELQHYKMSKDDLEADFPAACVAKATACVEDAKCRPELNRARALGQAPRCGSNASCTDLLACAVTNDEDLPAACHQPMTACIQDQACFKIVNEDEDEIACVLNDKCSETIKCTLEKDEQKCLDAHKECIGDDTCKAIFLGMSFVELEDVVEGGLARDLAQSCRDNKKCNASLICELNSMDVLGSCSEKALDCMLSKSCAALMELLVDDRATEEECRADSECKALLDCAASHDIDDAGVKKKLRELAANEHTITPKVSSTSVNSGTVNLKIQAESSAKQGTGTKVDDWSEMFPKQCTTSFTACAANEECVAIVESVIDGGDLDCKSNIVCKTFTACYLQYGEPEMPEDVPAKCQPKFKACQSDMSCRPLLNHALVYEQPPMCGRNKKCQEIVECYLTESGDLKPACMNTHTKCFADAKCPQFLLEEDYDGCFANQLCSNSMLCEADDADKVCFAENQKCFSTAGCAEKIEAVSKLELEDLEQAEAKKTVKTCVDDKLCLASAVCELKQVEEIGECASSALDCLMDNKCFGLVSADNFSAVKCKEDKWCKEVKTCFETPSERRRTVKTFEGFSDATLKKKAGSDIKTSIPQALPKVEKLTAKANVTPLVGVKEVGTDPTPTLKPTAKPEEKKKGKKSTNGGLIAGIVIAVLAAICGVGAAVYFFCMKEEQDHIV